MFSSLRDNMSLGYSIFASSCPFIIFPTLRKVTSFVPNLSYFLLLAVEVVKQFSGDGFLVFSPQLQTIQMPWFNSLSFRTRERFGLLMMILVGTNTSSIIEVSADENGVFAELQIKVMHVLKISMRS